MVVEVGFAQNETLIVCSQHRFICPMYEMGRNQRKSLVFSPRSLTLPERDIYSTGGRVKFSIYAQ